MAHCQIRGPYSSSSQIKLSSILSVIRSHFVLLIFGAMPVNIDRINLLMYTLVSKVEPFIALNNLYGIQGVIYIIISVSSTGVFSNV